MNIFLYIFFLFGGELLKEEDEKIYRFPAVQIICVDVGIYDDFKTIAFAERCQM